MRLQKECECVGIGGITMKRTWKKVIVGIVTATMVACSISNGECYIKNSVVEAADIEYVPLNEEFDKTYTAYFQLTEGGMVSFENSGTHAYKQVYKVLDNGNEEVYAYYTYKLRLAPGKYKVENLAYSVSNYINKISFESETETTHETEWNDTLDTADTIITNMGYMGSLNCDYLDDDFDVSSTADKDYYKFELSKSGKIQIQYFIDNLAYIHWWGARENCNKHDITICSEDEDGNVEEIFSVPTSSTDKTRYSKYYRLPKGTYYILVQGGLYKGAPSYCNDTDYQLKVNYEPEEATDHEQEYNDSKDTANTIATNTGYTGNIPTDADKDYYKFTLDKSSRVKLKMQVPRQSTDGLFSATLYKEDSTSKITNVKTTTNPIAYSTEQLLEAGTYYVAVEAGTTVEDAVDYTLTVNATEVVIVENISIIPEKTPAYVGDTFSMVAEVTPEDAENKEITWTSSDPTVATIDENGKVTCVGAGNVYITATAADGSGVKTEYLLSVSKVLVSGIVISTPSNQAVVGDKLTLTAEIKPTNALNQAIVWDSSNESVATVSQDGKVTCVGKGTVVISATAEDEGRISGSITLQVAEKVIATEVPEVTETPDNTETPEETNGAEPTKTPEETNGAEPTKTPEITKTPEETEEAEPTKTPEITETPEETKEAEPTKTPEKITTPEASNEAEDTQTPQVTATPEATNETETTKVPEITSAPEVTATPTPSSEQQQNTQTNTPFAGDLVQSIQLYTDMEEEELASIRVGDKFQVYADVFPEELEESEEVELSWSSSDKKVAKVSKNGMVTCVGEGTVTITATATDGSKVSSSLTFIILKAKSKNNYLSKLTISQGKLTPVFKKSKTKYTITLSKNMSSVIIKPVKMDSTAKVKIKGIEQSKIIVKLKSGKSKTVVIKVTAENGKVKTYRIHVKRK